MQQTRGTARLFINGKHVGTVTVRNIADSWGFGEFAPNAAFTEFAPLFGKWSLLMHADDDQERLSAAASEELRKAELALDSLRTTLEFDEHDEVLDLSQLNIDGNMVEWKIRQRRRYKPAV